MNNVSFLVVVVYKDFFGYYVLFFCVYVVLWVLLFNIDSFFCFVNVCRFIDVYNVFLKLLFDE